jgi:dihydropteroate synthase
LNVLKQRLDVIISIDTSTPQVLLTESALLGAGLINDVRALQRDGALVAAAATRLADLFNAYARPTEHHATTATL